MAAKPDNVEQLNLGDKNPDGGDTQEKAEGPVLRPKRVSSSGSDGEPNNSFNDPESLTGDYHQNHLQQHRENNRLPASPMDHENSNAGLDSSTDHHPDGQGGDVLSLSESMQGAYGIGLNGNGGGNLVTTATGNLDCQVQSFNEANAAGEFELDHLGAEGNSHSASGASVEASLDEAGQFLVFFFFFWRIFTITNAKYKKPKKVL